MSKHGMIKRYTLIIEKINLGQYPTFQMLKDYLYDYGFELSDRTLQRDIEQIRFEFGIEIKYNRYRRGYYIDKEQSFNTEGFFRFLEVANTAELLRESLIENKSSLSYISYGSAGRLKGISNLQPLLKAIKEHRKVSFTHFNFQKRKLKEHTLKPYLLREYLNRWYVVGVVSNQEKIKTFGVERIEDLELKAEKFKPQKDLDIHQMFEEIIGVVHTGEKPVKIILSFPSTQGHYAKTLPLHCSQEILIDDEQEFRIAITVVSNYELVQEILKHGNTIKVLEPKWLVDEVKETLRKMLGKYTE